MLKISSLQMQRLEIPFKHSFSHASAVRQETETVLVKVASSSMVGYGEGCPRSYVTAETLASCFSFFERVRPSLLERSLSLDSLFEFRRNFQTDIETNPAAWCAIESALLDLLARADGVCVEDRLGMGFGSGKTSYSAILGMAPLPVFQELVRRYRTLGMKDFKLKVEGHEGRDHERMHCLFQMIPDAQLRLDCNNLWSDMNQAYAYLKSLPDRFSAVEEPLAKAGMETLLDLRERLQKPLILDEHFQSIKTLKACPRPQDFIWNIRVSKVGGVLNAWEIMRYARAAEIKVIMGAQVGETSLLTRAALVLHAEMEPLACEGAFSTYLLHDDPFTPHLQFAEHGALSYGYLRAKAGWGLDFTCLA